MRLTTRTAFATVITGLVLAGGAVAPAQAAPVVTGGLVNVTVTDVDLLNNVSVVALNGVTLQVAAEICGVTVNALATDLGPDGQAVCDIDQTDTGTTTTTVTQRRGR